MLLQVTSEGQWLEFSPLLGKVGLVLVRPAADQARPTRALEGNLLYSSLLSSMSTASKKHYLHRII